MITFLIKKIGEIQMVIKSNMISRMVSGISGVVLAVGMNGCGPTLYVPAGVCTISELNCDTDKEYAKDDPCFDIVAKYIASHPRPTYSSNGSGSSLKDDDDPFGWKEQARLDAQERRDNYSTKKGKIICVKK